MHEPKNILLTGASSGMGAVIATTLAAAGHRVFAGMRNLATGNAAKARRLVEGRDCERIEPVEIDVTNDQSVQSCARQVIDRAGRIEVLVNCAGVMWTGPSEAFSVDQFETMLQTNLLGPFRLCKAVLPAMRARNDGLLITITSTCGRIVPPAFGIYAASKFGLEALSEAIGYEVADLGIDSVILEPGAFDTGLMGNQMEPADGAIARAYGDMDRFDQTLTVAVKDAMAKTPQLYDPQIVADAVAEVIALPRGQRPQRRPLGSAGSVSDMNRQIGLAQAAFLQGVGLGRLARVDQHD